MGWLAPPPRSTIRESHNPPSSFGSSARLPLFPPFDPRRDHQPFWDHIEFGPPRATLFKPPPFPAPLCPFLERSPLNLARGFQRYFYAGAAALFYSYFMFHPDSACPARFLFLPPIFSRLSPILDEVPLCLAEIYFFSPFSPMRFLSAFKNSFISAFLSVSWSLLGMMRWLTFL